jgi:nucleoside-diphosphate kinase
MLMIRTRIQARRVSHFYQVLYELELIYSIKSLTPSPALAKEHYSDLSARPFYGGLVKYITSGTPVVAM